MSTNIKLDAKTYKLVAKELNNIGGKWKGGKIQGFVFEVDPKPLFNKLLNGDKANLKKDFQFFETPETLVTKLIELADIQTNNTILEPSAGQGAIIRGINQVSSIVVDCYELMETNQQILKKSLLDFNLIGEDFLKHNSDIKYGRIIANPHLVKIKI